MDRHCAGAGGSLTCFVSRSHGHAGLRRWSVTVRNAMAAHGSLQKSSKPYSGRQRRLSRNKACRLHWTASFLPTQKIAATGATRYGDTSSKASQNLTIYKNCRARPFLSLQATTVLITVAGVACRQVESVVVRINVEVVVRGSDGIWTHFDVVTENKGVAV